MSGINIIDVLIIIVFIIGLLNGIRNGAIKSIVGLVGIIVVFVLAFQLKNPIAKILYSNLPFFEFRIFKGVAVFNILFYEFISFVIVCSLLMVFLRIILKVTKIVEKILDATIVLGIGSRILGAIISLAETYIIVFVALFFLNQPFFDVEGLTDSKLNSFILNKSLVLSSLVNDKLEATEELFELRKIYQNTTSVDEFNYSTLDILLKYGIIDVESVKTLQSQEKLKFKNLNELILKYGG